MRRNKPKLTVKGFQMTEPFSIVGNAKLNGKRGQTSTLTSSMRRAIVALHCTIIAEALYNALK